MAMRLAVLAALLLGFGVAPARGREADLVAELGRVLEEDFELVEEADADPAEARLLTDENGTEASTSTVTGTSTSTATATTTTTAEATATATATSTTTEDAEDAEESDANSTTTPAATTSGTSTATSTTTEDLAALQVTGTLTMSGMTQAEAEAFGAAGAARNAVIRAIAAQALASESAVEAAFTVTGYPGARRLGERRLQAWGVEVAYTITFATAGDAQAAATALAAVDGATWAAEIKSELTAAGLSGYDGMSVGAALATTTTAQPETTTTAATQPETSSTAAGTTTTQLGESGASPSAKAAVSVAVAVASLLVPSLL